MKMLRPAAVLLGALMTTCAHGPASGSLLTDPMFKEHIQMRQWPTRKLLDHFSMSVVLLEARGFTRADLAKALMTRTDGCEIPPEMGCHPPRPTTNVSPNP